MFLIGTRVLSGTGVGRAGRRGLRALGRCPHPRAASRGRGQFRAAAWPAARGQETAILALGKLGGREMTATSDLDLIVVYDFDPSAAGVGRAAPALRRAILRAPDAAPDQRAHRADQLGVLYQVDMRLRPSGRAGPLATQIGALCELPGNEAWTWEHMALTRARVVSARRRSRRGSRRSFATCCAARATRGAIAADVAEMRAAIAGEGDDESWDLKYAAGGLSTSSSSRNICSSCTPPRRPEILDTSTARVLDKAWRLACWHRGCRSAAAAVRLYHDLTQILRLCLHRAASTRRRWRLVARNSWPAPPTCPISPRSMFFSRTPK